MSADYLPDSPVRGMIPLKDYLRLQRENDDLRAQLTAIRDEAKPVLLAHEIEPQPGGKSQPRRAPSASSVAGRALEVVRRARTPMTTAAIAARLEIRSGKIASTMIDLCLRGYVVRADSARGPGKDAHWRAAHSASQPKE